MTETIRDEIQKAIQSLGLSDSDIRLLPEDEGRRIYDAALSHFVASGDRRWWWEDSRFPSTSVWFNDQKGFERIEKLIPNQREKVWFIVEDNQLAFYPVYEATPEAAKAVIGECYGFEYYVIAQDLSWLLCETHHANLIAIGAGVEERLRKLNV